MTNIQTLPGLIDCHVHFREPGFEHKGTMVSESASARSGGVMSVCEMPNTNPPTTTCVALKDKVARSAQIRDTDIRFFFGMTSDEHLEEFLALWKEAAYESLQSRCAGVKVYLDHSTGNQKIDVAVIKDVFRICAAMNVPLVAHCEDPLVNARDPRRPPESEERSVHDAITMARMYGTHLHIAHLSTEQGLRLVQQAKKDGLTVTCEAAPHHLFLSMEDEEILGAFGKMNPPLRTLDHQEALWGGILDGTIDCIATDHAPHTVEEKKSDHPPSGVPGVETMLPLLLTVVNGKWPHPLRKIRNPEFKIRNIERLCFENPNKIFGLEKKKDEWQVKVDLDQEWVIHGKDLHSKCGWTPFEGWGVQGKIIEVSKNSL
ncbi:dihydroorotase family protein [Candidatus Peregrinibacteria bacterium]|nr:dihydroorotase family protein [Candidatus Peregrinibacteria bacterium]